MATAHAKFTGEVGVCMATSGPGAIHLLNGLYDAKMDHQPVVAIIGQQARAAMGGSYQQEVDLISLYKDVAGYVQMAIEPSPCHRLSIAHKFRRCFFGSSCDGSLGSLGSGIGVVISRVSRRISHLSPWPLRFVGNCKCHRMFTRRKRQKCRHRSTSVRSGSSAVPSAGGSSTDAIRTSPATLLWILAWRSN